MKVLVVEDDPSVRETLGMVLEAYGHQPDLISDGEKSLEYLKTQWPDVMLLDLTLPGMSGEEVYRKINEVYGRVPPTVVLSAVQRVEARVKSVPGAWFLAKPYTIEQLSELLNVAAHSKSGAA